MKKVTTLLVVLLAVVFSTIAQNLTKLNVSTVKVKDFGAIMLNEQVKGYYYLYLADWKNKETSNFIFSVLDENLREVDTLNIIRPKSVELIETAFNGKAFALLLFDNEQQTFELLAYNNGFKQLATREIRINSYNARMFSYSLHHRTSYDPINIVPINGKGFCIYKQSEDNKNYEIIYYDNNLEQKWNYERPKSIDAKNKNAYTTTAINKSFQSPEMVLSVVVESLNKYSYNSLNPKLRFSIIGQNVQTGKTIFDTPIIDKDYDLKIKNIVVDTLAQNIEVFGEYTENSEVAHITTIIQKNLGFFSILLNKHGQVMSKKFAPWKEEIGKTIELDEKQRMEGKLELYTLQFIKVKDKVFVLGEQCPSSSFLVSGPAVFRSYDVMLFELDSSFKAKNATGFRNGISYTKAEKFFDMTTPLKYQFVQQYKNREDFIVAYIDYEDKRREENKVYNIIVYADEKKFVVDKIKYNHAASSFQIFPAKEGYVMVMEYFEKDKKMDMRLEKINY